MMKTLKKYQQWVGQTLCGSHVSGLYLTLYGIRLSDWDLLTYPVLTTTTHTPLPRQWI